MPETVYTATCSCDRWTQTGTATELDALVRGHDDSPWRRHVVSIYPIGPERDADFEAARLAKVAEREANR